MRKGTLSSDAPFGTLLGYAPGGVAIYSSNYGSLDPRHYPEDAEFRSYIGNEYMGHKWQCVEFARRFLFLNHGFVFTDVGMAWEIFSLRFLRQVVNDNILPLQAFANGSKRAPQAGALLIWQKGGEFQETGHVAVITQLLDDRVRIAEQNVIHSPLPMGQQWTRELRLSVENGCYTLHDTFSDTEILGWMIQTEETEHSIPQPEIDGELLKISGARLKNNRQFDGKWLNENDALQ
ncbi:CHAP domain-containing protein, partial [Enterobacter hormaechei]|nr:CHAP domain-containing protein [Enterobacter hormaechei]